MTFLGMHSVGEFLLFVTALFVGVSMIMGVNAVNSAPSFMLDYYKYLHNDPNATPKHPTFWAKVLTFYTVVTQVTQSILEPTNLTQFFCRFSLLFRLEASTLLMLVELLIIVIMPHTGTSEVSAMVGLMVAGFIGGVGRAYFENTCYALYGPCPSKHMSGVMVGVSLSGVLVSILQIILLASMDSDYNSVLMQSIIYFTISIAIIFLCAVLLIALLYNSFAKRYIAEFRSPHSAWHNIYCHVKDVESREGMYEISNVVAVGSVADVYEHEQGRSDVNFGNAEVSAKNVNSNKSLEPVEEQVTEVEAATTSEMLQKVILLTILKKVWPMMLSCFLVFAFTYLLYPGVLIAVDQNDFWFPTLVMAVYNFGDIIGRSISMIKAFWPSRRVVVIGSCLRVVFIPLLILCAKGIIPTQAAGYVLTAILAITNGFFGTLTMVYTPLTPGLTTDGERALAGQCTGVCLLIGCSFGVLLQLAVVLAIENILQQVDNQ